MRATSGDLEEDPVVAVVITEPSALDKADLVAIEGDHCLEMVGVPCHSKPHHSIVTSHTAETAPRPTTRGRALLLRAKR
jgi:hypothetical protein